MPENLLNQDSGIPKSLLKKITATPGYVWNGKTFIDSSGSVKSGTLTLTGNATAADVTKGKTFYTTSSSKKTGTFNVARYIIDTLEKYGALVLSETANDAVTVAGRSCKRSSSARAIWGLCSPSRDGAYGWICFSLSSAGAALTATTQYGDSERLPSVSTSYGTLYMSLMSAKVGSGTITMSVKENGKTHTLKGDFTVTSGSYGSTNFGTNGKNICNFIAWLLKNA